MHTVSFARSSTLGSDHGARLGIFSSPDGLEQFLALERGEQNVLVWDLHGSSELQGLMELQRWTGRNLSDVRGWHRARIRDLVKSVLARHEDIGEWDREHNSFLWTPAVSVYQQIAFRIPSISTPRPTTTVAGWLRKMVSTQLVAEGGQEIQVVRVVAEVFFRLAAEEAFGHLVNRGSRSSAVGVEISQIQALCVRIGRRSCAMPVLELALSDGVFKGLRLCSTSGPDSPDADQLTGAWSLLAEARPWKNLAVLPFVLMLLNGAKVRVATGNRMVPVRCVERPGLTLGSAGHGEYEWYVTWGDRKFKPSEFVRLARSSQWQRFLVVDCEQSIQVGPMHPVVIELAAELSDTTFDAKERDACMRAFSCLGLWVLDAVDPSVVDQRGPESVACLGFVRGKVPRIEIAFASRYTSQLDILSPTDGEDILVRWCKSRMEIVLRDRVAESHQLSRLANEWGTRITPGRWTYVVEGDEAVTEFLNRVPPAELKLLWDKGRPSPCERLDRAGLRATVSMRGSLLNVEGSYEYGGRSLTLSHLLSEIRNRRRFFRSRDGTWFEISEGFAAQLRMLAAGYCGENEIGVQIAPWAALSLAEIGAEGGSIGIPSGLALPTAERLREASALGVALPNGLQTVLRDYQVAGYEWLVRTAHWAPGAILGDDMGLGKTLQALAFLARRRHLGPTLVIASVTLIENWRREVAKHLPGVLRTRVVHGSRSGDITGAAGPGDVVIATYGRVSSQPTEFTRATWRTVVIDEAHELRNEKTKRSAAIRSLLAAQAVRPFVLAITGTPIQNRIGDVYSLLELVAPGYFGERIRFVEHFGALGEIADELRNAMRPFVLRRRKRDVALDLPERVDLLREVELAAEERSRYEELRRSALNELQNPEGLVSSARVLVAIQQLRQLSCDARLVDPGYRGTCSKTEFVIETIEVLLKEERPVLVFSQFTRYLTLLGSELDEKSIDWMRIDGTMSATERMAAIDRFQRGDADVMLISLRAGGMGISLVRASDVLIVDPWWNAAAEEQAANRVHRIGQDKTVVVQRIVARDTIEARVMAISRGKQEMIDSVINGGDLTTPATVEELIALLEAAAIDTEGQMSSVPEGDATTEDE